MKMRKNVKAASVALASLVLAPVAAFAQLDISTELASATTDITTAVVGVGAVLIAGAALTVGYKWAMRMFGR